MSPTTWGLEGKVTPWERATYDIKTGSFTSIIWSSNGVNLRNSTNLSDRSNVNVGYKGQVFTFDAWTYGEAVPDLTTGKPDALWFRINQNGKSYWVPSAYTNGYPPGNPPLLPPANSNPINPSPINPNPINPNPINPNPINPNPINPNPINPNPTLPPSSISINGRTIGGSFYPVFQNYKATLGNPTSDAINYNGVSYQTFDKGSIVSSKNGTFPLYGAIRQEFLKTGGLDGRLGAPKSAEKGQGDGTLIQYFEKGYISWNGVKAIAYEEGSKPPTTQIPINKPIQSSDLRNINTALDKWNGKTGITDPNGYYPGQCVSLVKTYTHELGITMGVIKGNNPADPYNEGAKWGFVNPSLPPGKFEKIKFTANEQPQVGDIIFFDATPSNGYGHVAVVQAVSGNSQITIQESNGYEASRAVVKRHSMNLLKSDRGPVMGWLRLKP
ncbi:MAG: CHAP domain-containing protein [Oscillatoriales cyanobacterium]|nr:MAG: CHAP domain-containing protein [Oscillatoriales cyanobacterium]